MTTRITNTSRLWFVTAYARASNRPAKSASLVIYCWPDEGVITLNTSENQDAQYIAKVKQGITRSGLV
jgi:hypothetical protein